MIKTLLQFFVLVFIFLATWLGLSNIDFVRRFHLGGMSKKTENKIGNIIFDGIKKADILIDDDSTTRVLDVIKDRLCTTNSIDPESIHIHLVKDAQVNAFAIPGHHIIVYTGLINHCDSVSQLCGVLSHELGHIQLDHVVKRLISELGTTLLASVATNGNSQVAGKIIKMLSSSAFERQQETDADAVGVQYLTHAHINPKGFSDFMLKMAEMHSGTPAAMEWISSHPDSKKRAGAILGLIGVGADSYTPALDSADWQLLKNSSSL